MIAAGGQIALVFLVKAPAADHRGRLGRRARLDLARLQRPDGRDLDLVIVAYLNIASPSFGSSSGVLTVVTVGLARGGRADVDLAGGVPLARVLGDARLRPNTLIFLVTGIAIAYHIPTLPASDYLTRLASTPRGSSSGWCSSR